MCFSLVARRKRGRFYGQKYKKMELCDTLLTSATKTAEISYHGKMLAG